ncbi:MAG TPA: DUF4189 domain-containing protein [Solirubrobacterales bacterium]
MGQKRAISIMLALALAAFAATTVAPAAAEAAYGAIAVNPNTGAAGVSWGYSTKKAAKKRAKRECMGRCKVVVWVRNGCAAVVHARGRYFWGAARKKDTALKRARRVAKRRTGVKKARRVAWTCSG